MAKESWYRLGRWRRSRGRSEPSHEEPEVETPPGEPGDNEAPETPPAEPVAQAVPVVVAPGPSPVGLIRGVASDYKAVASLIGLLVYGIVRVSYDAYYTRLGVFPEAVGLTETTILGRAVLYLALTVSVGAILGGLWFGAVRLALPRLSGLPPWGLAATILAPAAVAVALVVASEKVRDLLVERHFAYYCFQRCKFQPLDESTLATLNGLAARNASEHPAWHVTDLGPAWFVALPLVFLCVAAALVPVISRSGSARARRSAIGAFAALAAASLSASLLAPHVEATLRDAAVQDPSATLLGHQSLVWRAVFVLFLRCGRRRSPRGR